MEEKIMFQTDEGEVAFYVLEQTRLSGVNYLLVTDSEDEDAECLVLKDTSKDSDLEAAYEIVTDDDLLDVLLPIFTELLEDVDIQKEN